VLILLLSSLGPLAATAGDPWGSYNTGVQAYAGHDFTNALQQWEDLSLAALPRRLQLPVWFQMGNTQFRLGEPLEQGQPEQAAELWRRSCEAYRTALLAKPRDEATRHNLALVQRRLANLTHRLGIEAFNAAQKQPLDTAIDRLHDSTENLKEAAALAPEDAAFRQDRDRAQQALRDRLMERARQAETQGDTAAAQRNQWADRNAEQSYRAALEDLATAAQPEAAESQPTDPQVQAAQGRVSQKLADLLTRKGQAEQKEGNQMAQYDPDQALDRLEAALQDFTAAQEVQPQHAAAQRGEREVRAALEQLQVKEGQEQLQQGREQLARQDPQAARSLNAALGHFEAALELKPTSAPAQKGAEEARQLLPAALALAGQNEMRAGDRAEPQSPSDALSRFQEAEKDFQQALEMQPGQPQAKQGLQEVEPKLARVREKVAKQAEAAAKQISPPNRRPPTLESLLGQVEQKEPLSESERQRQRARKDASPRKPYPDW
jgi:tetratricopeptide (TPR) repeat protein